MKKTLVVLVGLAFAGVAQAQIKCWNDAQGKRVCGDAPPAGAKVTTIRGTTPSADRAPAPAAKDAAAKDAKKGPLTPAEREQEYRKRQAEAQKASEKAAGEQKDKEAKLENCDRAKEMLRVLETGERIQRTDSKGERYIMEDAQREQEGVKARQLAQQNCG